MWINRGQPGHEVDARVRKLPAGGEMGRAGLSVAEQRKKSSERGRNIKSRQIFTFNESRERFLVQGNRTKTE